MRLVWVSSLHSNLIFFFFPHYKLKGMCMYCLNRSGRYEVDGYVYNASEEPKILMTGKWNESMSYQQCDGEGEPLPGTELKEVDNFSPPSSIQFSSKILTLTTCLLFLGLETRWCSKGWQVPIHALCSQDQQLWHCPEKAVALWFTVTPWQIRARDGRHVQIRQWEEQVWSQNTCSLGSESEGELILIPYLVLYSLEERQRAEKRTREEKGQSFTPKWFDITEEVTPTPWGDLEVYQFNAKYSEHREAADSSEDNTDPKSIQFNPWQFQDLST